MVAQVVKYRSGVVIVHDACLEQLRLQLEPLVAHELIIVVPWVVEQRLGFFGLSPDAMALRLAAHSPDISLGDGPILVLLDGFADTVSPLFFLQFFTLFVFELLHQLHFGDRLPAHDVGCFHLDVLSELELLLAVLGFDFEECLFDLVLPSKLEAFSLFFDDLRVALELGSLQLKLSLCLLFFEPLLALDLFLQLVALLLLICELGPELLDELQLFADELLNRLLGEFVFEVLDDERLGLALEVELVSEVAAVDGLLALVLKPAVLHVGVAHLEEVPRHTRRDCEDELVEEISGTGFFFTDAH